MCAGIRDVVNLCWKLTLVLDGIATNSILDTYQIEREPHVRSVISEAIKQGQLICTTDPELAKIRDQVIEDLAQIPNLSFYDALPDLKDGILSNPGETSISGHLAIHPMVSSEDQGLVFLDEVTGTGFRLISREKDPLQYLTPASQELWQKLGGTCLTINQGSVAGAGVKVVKDIDGKISQLMDEGRFTSFLIRPDHYVFGCARSISDVELLILDLGLQLGVINYP